MGIETKYRTGTRCVDLCFLIWLVDGISIQYCREGFESIITPPAVVQDDGVYRYHTPKSAICGSFRNFRCYTLSRQLFFLHSTREIPYPDPQEAFRVDKHACSQRVHCQQQKPPCKRAHSL